MSLVGLLHFQHPTRCFFNLAGICQPALFYLQPAPLGQTLVLEGLEGSQLHGEKTALVACINDTQRAADISDQNQ